jgi:hypothetical protein
VARMRKVSLDKMPSMGRVEPGHRRINNRRQRMSRRPGQPEIE